MFIVLISGTNIHRDLDVVMLSIYVKTTFENGQEPFYPHLSGNPEQTMYCIELNDPK